jgi:glutaminyl-peptide cyclotransferase
LNKVIKMILFFCLLTTTTAIASNQQTALKQLLINSKTPEYKYKIIKSYPHDIQAFTEGLLLDDGYLYESSGLYAKSHLKKTKFFSGQIVKEYSLPPQYFAEGLTIIGHSLYQLTYREKTGFVYDKNTFKLEKTFHYPTEGWGLTTDGKQLIMSNGSNTLSFIDPQTFKLTRALQVTDQTHQPINSLNALAFIHGRIFANIRPSNIIVIISPQSGLVETWLNIDSLKPRADYLTAESVANGIAYDKQNDVLLVTGKNWPYLYAIKLKQSP